MADTSEDTTMIQTVTTVDENTTAQQVSENAIQIEELDLEELSKSGVITVEKLETGEETYIFHTDQLEIANVSTQQTGMEVVGTGAENEVIVSLPKLTKMTTNTVSQNAAGGIRKLSDVKITPVRAYVASEEDTGDWEETREMSTSTQTEETDSEEGEAIEVSTVYILN